MLRSCWQSARARISTSFIAGHKHSGRCHMMCRVSRTTQQQLSGQQMSAHVAVQEWSADLLAAGVPRQGAWYWRMLPFPRLRPAWGLHLHTTQDLDKLNHLTGVWCTLRLLMPCAGRCCPLLPLNAAYTAGVPAYQMRHPGFPAAATRVQLQLLLQQPARRTAKHSERACCKAAPRPTCAACSTFLAQCLR